MGNQVEAIPLDEWVESHPSEEEMRTVFINMDVALEYIHKHGYCIDVFYPTMIDVLNNNPNYIRFRKLIELSKKNRDAMIREDIFNSSLVQIGMYSNCLKYLTPEFLKSNFDSFTQFLPASDVPYYRGVIQRGASVYLGSYVVEKKKRDLAELEKEISSDGDISNKGNPLVKSSNYSGVKAISNDHINDYIYPQINGNISNKGNSLVKSNGKYNGVENISNDKINDSIYSQINGMKDAAFVNVLVISSIILLSLFFMSFISWVVSILW